MKINKNELRQKEEEEEEVQNDIVINVVAQVLTSALLFAALHFCFSLFNLLPFYVERWRDLFI